MFSRRNKKDLFEDNLYSDEEDYTDEEYEEYEDYDTDEDEIIEENENDEDEDYACENEGNNNEDYEDNVDFEDDYNETDVGTEIEKVHRSIFKRRQRTEEEEEERANRMFKKVMLMLFILIFCIGLVVISYYGTTYYLANLKIEELKADYPYSINGKNVMDTELAPYVPKEYIESLDNIIEEYALDKKLAERGMEYIEEVPYSLSNTEEYKAMSYQEQLRTVNSYILGAKKDYLLSNFLEFYRSFDTTKIETTYHLNAVETSSGKTISLSYSSADLDTELVNALESISVGGGVLNAKIKGIAYSTVTLVDKNVNYIYSDTSILEAKKSMDIELNSIKAKFIVTDLE